MSGYDDQVTRALQRIASDAVKDKVQDSYNGVGEAMKELGAPSNNMLLAAIHAESKRSSDAICRLDSRILKLENSLSSLLGGMGKLCELMEIQNTIISTNQNNVVDMVNVPRTPPTRRQDMSTGSVEWFYQGTKLTSKFLICTCIVSHLIELVRLRMENRGIYYPDSVDANFQVLGYCVRDSSKARCNIPGVSFKNEIEIPDMSKKAVGYESILPLIASRDPSSITTLPETRLSELSTVTTRSIMEAVSRVVQRLCYLECILSPQQIDILKSLRFPVLKSGENEFNCDESAIRPRCSNPLSSYVSSMPPKAKSVFIFNVMKGQTVSQACVEQENQSKQKF